MSEPAFLIRNLTNGEMMQLIRDVHHNHPAWAHEQLGTTSEEELQSKLAGLSVARFIRTGRHNMNETQQDGNGVYLSIPNGAIAWKQADPTEGARWLYDEPELHAIRAKDPSLIVSFPGE
ncbi:MAG: hypothetical protein ACRETQ_10490 [Gammaproteobacteria bacterium]